MIETITLSKGERNLSPVVAKLSSLPKDKAFKLEIREFRPTRSNEQNAKLWAIYQEILKTGGETMAGWTKDDLHEFFLGEHFGWEVRSMFSQKRRVPVRRSSKLNKLEFMELIEFIYRYMAQLGVFIK